MGVDWVSRREMQQKEDFTGRGDVIEGVAGSLQSV